MKKVALLSVAILFACSVWATDGDGSSKQTTTTSVMSSGSETEVEKPNPSATGTNAGVQGKRTGIRLSGFSRLVGFYRNLDQYYASTVTLRGLTVPRTITIGDGSANPAFMLAMEVNPSSKTSILVETALHHNFLAATSGIINNNQGGTASLLEEGKVASIFSRFGVNGTTHTKFGTFKLIAGGGMNWAKISPFTLWTFQYRDDMFERYPWDPAGSNWRRYNSFYSTGDIPRDLRWGNRSTAGFNIVAEGLPYGLEGKLLIGKTSVSGGWQNYLTDLPQNVVAGRVGKQVGPVLVGFNYFNQYGYDTSIARVDTGIILDGTKYQVESNRTSQLISTIDGKFDYQGKMRVYVETGVGSYLSRTHIHPDSARAGWSADKINRYKRYFDPIAYAEFDVKKSLFGLPFKGSLFYIGREAVNNSSAILNSANEEGTDGRNLNTLGAGNNNTLYIESLVTEIGQVTNNRTGGTFEYKKSFGKFIVEAGLGIQQEIENLALDSTVNGGRLADVDLNGGNGVRNSVSFYHIVNQYQRSRFDYINRFVGPYNRLQADFRRSWENVAITDTIIDYKKSFNMLDLAAKYKTKVFGKELILTAFGRANSVQEKVSPLPVLSDKAFVRQWYEEFMWFYKLHNKVTLLGFVSFQQVKGNSRTELAFTEESEMGVDQEVGDLILGDHGKPISNGETFMAKQENGSFAEVTATGGKPIEQRGFGYGVGLDYDFVTNGSIDVRYRWYGHKDLVFLNDQFKGNELTVELKVFF